MGVCVHAVEGGRADWQKERKIERGRERPTERKKNERMKERKKNPEQTAR
jgi:hypothetical protein